MTTNRRTLLWAEQRRYAKTAARVAGCTCKPDLRYRSAGHLVAHHELWCPAIDAPSQIVIYATQRCER